MTSTYDTLANFYYLAQNNPKFENLVLAIYDEVISQINKVNPQILYWDTWKGKSIYGEGLEGKASFINDAHSILDHNSKYHLKTIELRLEYLISRIGEYFIRYPDRPDWEKSLWLEFKYKTIRLYPKIFAELKKFVPNPKEYNKRLARQMERWGI